VFNYEQNKCLFQSKSTGAENKCKGQGGAIICIEKERIILKVEVPKTPNEQP
jgi:hypothetical protein